jgi:hypothetical protein
MSNKIIVKRIGFTKAPIGKSFPMKIFVFIISLGKSNKK